MVLTIADLRKKIANLATRPSKQSNVGTTYVVEPPPPNFMPAQSYPPMPVPYQPSPPQFAPPYPPDGRTYTNYQSAVQTNSGLNAYPPQQPSNTAASFPETQSTTLMTQTQPQSSLIRPMGMNNELDNIVRQLNTQRIQDAEFVRRLQTQLNELQEQNARLQQQISNPMNLQQQSQLQLLAVQMQLQEQALQIQLMLEEYAERINEQNKIMQTFQSDIADIKEKLVNVDYLIHALEYAGANSYASSLYGSAPSTRNALSDRPQQLAIGTSSSSNLQTGSPSYQFNLVRNP